MLNANSAIGVPLRGTVRRPKIIEKYARQSGVQIQILQYVIQKSIVIHSQYAKVNAVVGVVVLFLFFHFKDNSGFVSSLMKGRCFNSQQI